MRALRGVIVLVLALALPAPVWAADFQAGREASIRGDYATALKEWRPLAEQGHAEAQFHLAALYEEGWGVAPDYAEAAKWYRLAADQGHAGAQLYLGFCYRNGWLVPQDRAEAAKWYRRAAEQGDDIAPLHLAAMYGHGEGVTRDYVQAHMWSIIASSRLSPGEDRDGAVRNRYIVEGEMTPEQIAEAQRLASEWKPK